MAARTKARAKLENHAKTGAKGKAKVKAKPKRISQPRSFRETPAATSPKPVAQPLMDALRAEHRHMATVMQLLADQLKAIEAGELVDTHVVYEIMHYMVTWPDRFHHPREDLIYARVAEITPSMADDVDTLQRDHDNTAKSGRGLLRDIERWRIGEITGLVVVNNGRAYIDHIHEHMNVEEKLVFPRIEQMLTLQDWRELAEDDQLQAVSRPVFGPLVQREFRNMTRKLRRGVRRAVERGTLLEWLGIESFMESVDVVSIAVESARDTTGDSLRGAWRDSLQYFREAPLSAPLRSVVNNTRISFRLLGEVADISRETLDDLARVNQERKDRVRWLSRNTARR
jgi:hemerythrin-like domain-containing protein